MNPQILPIGFWDRGAMSNELDAPVALRAKRKEQAQRLYTRLTSYCFSLALTGRSLPSELSHVTNICVLIFSSMVSWRTRIRADEPPLVMEALGQKAI
jgi:hypothetical protein